MIVLWNYLGHFSILLRMTWKSRNQLWWMWRIPAFESKNFPVTLYHSNEFSADCFNLKCLASVGLTLESPSDESWMDVCLQKCAKKNKIGDWLGHSLQMFPYVKGCLHSPKFLSDTTRHHVPCGTNSSNKLSRTIKIRPILFLSYDMILSEFVERYHTKFVFRVNRPWATVDRRQYSLPRVKF
jgi:hypothetical protein